MRNPSEGARGPQRAFCCEFCFLLSRLLPEVVIGWPLPIKPLILLLSRAGVELATY